MNEENGEQETLNPEVETTTEENTAETQENVEEVKARLAKAEELANNYKIRAEKAEKEFKAVRPEVKENESILTTKDVLTLTSEGITQEEDVDFAEKWARFNSKSVSEAIKDPIFKSVLNTRREERTTALATQTRGGARGVAKVSGEDLIVRARKGELSENDEDIQKMVEARFNAKLKK